MSLLTFIDPALLFVFAAFAIIGCYHEFKHELQRDYLTRRLPKKPQNPA